MNETYEGLMYLTVRNDEYVHAGHQRKIKPVKTTATYPREVPTGCIVIRVKVVVPRRAFEAFVPTADLVVDGPQAHMPVEVVQA